MRYGHELIAAMNNYGTARAWRELEEISKVIHRQDIVIQQLRSDNDALNAENRILHEELGDFNTENCTLENKVTGLENGIRAMFQSLQRQNTRATHYLGYLFVALGLWLLVVWYLVLERA